jgi:hypothetical protein
VLSERQNVTPFVFNSSGDLNVTIRYTDLNGTDVESGTVFSDMANDFRIDYANGSRLDITVGLKAGNPGSLWIEATDANASTSCSVLLPKLDADYKKGYEYDATLVYSQGKVKKSGRIGR